MKVYREVYFKGEEQELNKFVREIKGYVLGEWDVTEENDYLNFSYIGNDVDKSNVYIHLGGNLQKGEINVVNIVPIEKSSLSTDEYNLVLLKFYNDIIKPYKESGTVLEITEPSADEFIPTSVISETALQKLISFCNLANKSTGSVHPCDRQRWFDFICQTVNDEKMFDYDTLNKFLQDESYWGKKPDGFIGCVGRYAWSSSKAEELALEYEGFCEILNYYKTKKGL